MHPSQYKLYEKDKLLKAYEAVLGGMSVQRAAEEYNTQKVLYMITSVEK